MRHLSEHSQSTVFVSLHYLALSGPFIVYAAKVQHTVHDHTVQLGSVFGPHSLGICSHSIERYEHIAAYHAATRVVEGDDVCKIVVIEKPAVDIYYTRIVAEYIRQLAHAAVVICRDGDNPSLEKSGVNVGEIDPVGQPLKCVCHLTIISQQKYKLYTTFAK